MIRTLRDGARAKPFVLAVWFGLLTGFAEVLVLSQQYFYPLWYQRERDRFILLGSDVAWMAPIADVVLFAILGALLYLLFWSRPRLASFRVTTATFCFLTVLSLLCLRIPLRFSFTTKVILALGIAVQASHFLRRRVDAFHSFVRLTLPWMAIAVVLMAAGVRGWQFFKESQASARLPATSADRPNVLLIVLDTVRAQSLSLYGYARPTTPGLERLASTGVVFDRAFATAPWTLPSIASIFTGRFARETSADWWRPLNNAHVTLAEVLANEGYATAGFVGNMVFGSEEFGLHRGFGHYEVYTTSPGQYLLSSSLGRFFGCWFSQGLGCELRPLLGYYESLGRKTASQINVDVLAWLANRDKQRPFFAFLNYFDAHHPYLPPAPFDEMFGPRRFRKNPGKLRDDYSNEEALIELDAYEGAIADLDHQVGRLLDQLAGQQLLNNTVVIVTSDHGESFLDHGVVQHGNSLYATQLHVPLLISWPARLPAGKRVYEPVTLRDLPATVLDAIGLGDRALMPGSSLAVHWAQGPSAQKPPDRLVLSEASGQPNEPRRFPVSRGNMSSLLLGSFHYIRNGDAREELYNIENDPWEQTDLARHGSEPMLSRFRDLLGFRASKPAASRVVGGGGGVPVSPKG